MRTCRECNKEKTEAEFYYSKRDGYAPLCKVCYLIRHKLYRQTYRNKHRQSSIGRQRQWRIDNPEKYNASVLNYRKAHPIQVREQNNIRKHRRRASEAGAGGSHSLGEWENKKAEFEYRCAYCGCKPDLLEKDHIIPISKGGSDWIENIMPSCPHCNKVKHNKLGWGKQAFRLLAN